MSGSLTISDLAFDTPRADALATPLRQGRLGDFEAKSEFAACLLPLLNALGWRRELREVAESLPHFANTLDLADLRNVLARLGYKTIRVEGDAGDLDIRLLPCLLVKDGEDEGNGEDQGSLVLLERGPEGRMRVYDGALRQETTVNARDLAGTLYLVTPEIHSRVEEKFEKENWLREITRRFRGTIALLAGMTFFLNILALLVPLFIMAVYDQVIPSRSPVVLGYLVAGIALALLAEGTLRVVRTRVIAFLGGRIENIVATSALKQVLALPASMTETAPLGGQVSRLREFDAVRDLFTGPLVSVVLEAPFVILFLAVIGAIAGPLVIIPAVMIGVFALAMAVLSPRLKRAVAASGTARAKRHGFLVETVTNLRTIRETNASKVWLGRYRDISAEASYAQFEVGQITFLFQTLAQAIMMAAGLATIAFGVLRVIDGVMGIGALIATMALVWRVLAPMQSMFLTLSRFEQIKISLRQINQLMAMTGEADDYSKAGKPRRFIGAIGLFRTSFRYQPDTEPALLGVNFNIRPGEIVAITGPSGSGKSTILRLLLGLYTPQAGQVLVDGLDLRQINPKEMRRAIAYVPQTENFFHGSIAQNLRLASPSATDQDITAACRAAGVLNEIFALKDGFETWLGDQNTRHLSAGFRQRLSLARAYVKKAPILLLDEPAQRLDEAGDALFIEALEKIRGSATVIMITHRPSHMRLADRILVMNRGLLIADGSPEEILPKLLGEANK